MIWWRDFIFLLLLTAGLAPSLSAADDTPTTTIATTTISTNGSLIATPEAQTALSAAHKSGQTSEQVDRAKTFPILSGNELAGSALPASEAQPPAVSPSSSPANRNDDDDEDVVISSSEILTDSRATSERLDLPDAANCSKLEQQLRDANAETNFVTVDTDQVRYSNSRLVLRLLLVSLFGLVCLSLTFVYTLKFCLCGRRKRHLALQRNLVADSQLNAAHLCPLASPFAAAATTDQHHRQFLSASECSCGLINRRTRASSRGSRLHSWLRPSLWGLCRDSLDPASATCRLPRQAIPTLYQQLAVADRIQQLSTLNANYYPPIGCPSCLLDLQCRFSGASGGGHSSPLPVCGEQPPASRPPAYSELFGARQTLESGAISLSRSTGGSSSDETQCDFATSCAEVTTVNTSSASATPLDPLPQVEGAAAAAATAAVATGNLPLLEPATSQPQVASDPTARNLLVKLNLNKTKLLSAGDLVLLSRLIDVPIVVQEQSRQNQRQSQQQHLGDADDDQVTIGAPTMAPDQGRQVTGSARGPEPTTTINTAKGSVADSS